MKFFGKYVIDKSVEKWVKISYKVLILLVIVSLIVIIGDEGVLVKIKYKNR